MNKKKLYIAAPLFSQAEKMFNGYLKKVLSSYFDVYLPQEDGLLIVDMIKKGTPFKSASRMVFAADIQALENTDILLIVLDGRTVDEGAAMELGYAFSKGKQCIGFSTDPRTLLPDGQNPMIVNCLDTIVHSFESLIEHAYQYAEVSLCVLC